MSVDRIKEIRKYLIFLLFLLGATFVVSHQVQAKTYTITTKTKPCDGMKGSDKYNSKTKSFLTIRSYLQKIAKEKGGTLRIKKGTYKISNTLYVDSNTHIVLEKGAKLVKIKNSGVKTMPASSTMFQFVSEKKANKKASVGKHKGVKNVSIVGKGNATIDLGYVNMGTRDVIAIIMGHNTNVKLKNISFKNMYYGHMIEMDACKNVKIENCKFIGFKPSGKHNKEAINLDTPDKNRNGFNSAWSKKDCTPNEKVTIKNCSFDRLEAGVGTHQYTGHVYQKNVTITGCKFNNVQTAVRVLNWKNAVVTKNTFTNCNPNSRYPYALFIAGARGITFGYNSFINCGRDRELLQFWCDRGYNANQFLYDATTSSITEEQAELFLTNKASNCGYILCYDCPYDVNFSE